MECHSIHPNNEPVNDVCKLNLVVDDCFNKSLAHCGCNTLSLTHQTMTARAQTDKPGKAHGSSMFIAVSDVAKSKTGLSEPPETHTDLINRLKTHSVWLWVWFGNHCTCHQQVEQLCRMLAHQNEQLRTNTANMVIATFLAPAKMQGNTLEKHVSQKKRTCVSS